MKKTFKVGCGCLAVIVGIGIIIALIGMFFGVGTDSNRSQQPSNTLSDTSTPPAGDPADFVSVIDGDTLETSKGKVRLIGIDTPERGECGYEPASKALERVIAPGSTVYLELPPGQNDQDSYGRLIRYVATEQAVDLGLLQLEQGNAVTRYDSSDGYPKHPREAEYAQAQRATLDANGKVVTVACATDVVSAADSPVEPAPSESVPIESSPSTAPATTPAPLDASSSNSSWWREYGSCSRLKKNTVGHPTGPFDRNNPAEAEIYDWFAYGTGHNGDGDWDGLACE